MLDFEYYNPTRIVFGRDAEKKLGDCAKQFGSRVLLHYGGSFAKKRGLVDELKTLLEKENIIVTELGGVKPNPRLSLVREGARLCRENDIDLIVAVGGGSVIDSAKGIAASACTEGDIWDYYMDASLSVKAALPVGVVLTIPAAGSESSDGSVITDDLTQMKRFINSALIVPKFALMNPELTYSLNPYQTACGAFDMLSHLMERYFTNEKDTELTDRLIEGAAKTIIYSAPRAIEKPDDYAARSQLMHAATIAHNGLLDCGRMGDWASHNIGMELSAEYDSVHGETLSVITPAWMQYVYTANISRFVQFGQRVFGIDFVPDNAEEAVSELITRLKAWSRSIGLPTCLRDIDIGDEDFEEMAHKCLIGRPCVGALKELGEQDVINIFKLAL